MRWNNWPGAKSSGGRQWPRDMRRNRSTADAFVGRRGAIAAGTAVPEELGIQDLDRLFVHAPVRQADRLGSPIERGHGAGDVDQVVAEVMIPAAEGDDEQPQAVARAIHRTAQLRDLHAAAGCVELLAQADLHVAPRSQQPAQGAEVLDLALPHVGGLFLVVDRVQRRDEDQRQIVGRAVAARGRHAVQRAADPAEPLGQRAGLALRAGQVVAGPALPARRRSVASTSFRSRATCPCRCRGCT